MKEIINILIIYWKPIVGILFAIAGFIIALIKKKPLNDILTDIYYASIGAVNYVENSAILGSANKLNAAIEYVNDELVKKYPTLNVKRYASLIARIIEDILETPHKKGE